MFKFARGTNRTVILVPSLGIVLKFPLFYWSNAKYVFVQAWYQYKDRHLGPKRGGLSLRAIFRQELLEYTVEYPYCLKGALGKGIVDNWRERRYYKRNAGLRDLLQPTYFTFLGLLNIQKYGEPIGSKEDSIGAILYKEFFKEFGRVAAQDLRFDGHHWQNPSNFHLHEGQIRVLDYGDISTQQTITRHGLEVLRRPLPDSLRSLL